MKRNHALSRRTVLTAIGGIGVVALVGCDDSPSPDDGVTDGGMTDGGSTGGGGTDGGVTTEGWATGGTALMVGKDYGNPFVSGVGPTCTVYKASTEGPCHATSPLLTRRDVSEGYAGLPMRLELLIVDAACNPVPNAIVEIWMCDTKGVYSGDIDGNNDAFCTGGSSQAAAALWGRGIQTAGADGRVTFDANFPGWYASRATHIHFRVSVGSSQYIVSQLFFDDALKVAIYNSQPNYKATSGQGYVSNSSDNVVNQAGLSVSQVVCSTAKQSDGAMLAWKAITVSA
jgi:protocatechuate 3,4-dioxygenase beta subunit